MSVFGFVGILARSIAGWKFSSMLFSSVVYFVVLTKGEWSSVGSHVLSLTKSKIRSKMASLKVLYTLGPIVAPKASLVRMYAMHPMCL